MNMQLIIRAEQKSDQQEIAQILRQAFGSDDAVVVRGHSGFYPRFGFTPSVAYNIQSEYDIPAEVFMIKPLTEKSLAGCSGTIKYHQAFNEL